jgi:chemotaxis signal transduction protein
MAFEKGQRLSLLVEAGAARYAIDATRVLEVAPPDLKGGETLHGHHHLKDLCALLGGPPEVRPGTAVVLDTSPTLAVRVKRVFEVVDAADKPVHPLPRKLVRRLEPAVRGVLEVNKSLYFELDVDAAARGLEAWPPELLEGALPTAPEPDRALVFESQGRRLAVPLSSVSQVVKAGETLCALPHGGPLLGLVLHQAHLWPIISVPGMAGGAAAIEPLAVLVEVAGEGVGLMASKAFGVAARGGLQGAAVIDLARLFS